MHTSVKSDNEHELLRIFSAFRMPHNIKHPASLVCENGLFEGNSSLGFQLFILVMIPTKRLFFRKAACCVPNVTNVMVRRVGVDIFPPKQFVTDPVDCSWTACAGARRAKSIALSLTHFALTVPLPAYLSDLCDGIPGRSR